jgi:hypothetical protein
MWNFLDIYVHLSLSVAESRTFARESFGIAKLRVFYLSQNMVFVWKVSVDCIKWVGEVGNRFWISIILIPDMC